MGSSSGTSSSASEEDLRKRKRMISNRESARRSRMRKQKRVDDLTADISRLKEENHQIMSGVSVATQRFMNIEAENSVLRAQAGELSRRLEALDDIIRSMKGNNSCSNPLDESEGFGFLNSINMFSFNPHPVAASADMLQY